MITDVFTENFRGASAARSIYVALSQIASDQQSDTFDASQSVIAHRAGLSVATVKRVLPIFRDLGLVVIKRNYVNNIEQSSTYTLVRASLAHHELTPVLLPKTK